MKREVVEELRRHDLTNVTCGDAGGEYVVIGIGNSDSDRKTTVLNISDADWLIDRLRFYTRKAKRRLRERKR